MIYFDERCIGNSADPGEFFAHEEGYTSEFYVGDCGGGLFCMLVSLIDGYYFYLMSVLWEKSTTTAHNQISLIVLFSCNKFE